MSDILFEQRGVLGLITLNRPKALNALTYDMALKMSDQLLAWADDPSVTRVAVQGAGEKGFCAGGDIRALYDSGQGDKKYAREFYYHEYRLNHLVKHFPKPYIALIDGITMGGGVGVSVHGSHRIATERTLFAMPETGIGLFPDVGGTYFLPRLGLPLGVYLGLTGERLKAADSLESGVATHYVPGDDLDALIDDLGEDSDVDLILMAHQQTPPQDTAKLPGMMANIDRHFAEADLTTILSSLESDKGDWAKATLDSIRTKSPISMAVSVRQLATGATLNFDDCMRLEYRLARRFVEGVDFYEGVRAVVIDKDNAPQWHHSRIEDVTPDEVDAYFASLGDEELKFFGED